MVRKRGTVFSNINILEHVHRETGSMIMIRCIYGFTDQRDAVLGQRIEQSEFFLSYTLY